MIREPDWQQLQQWAATHAGVEGYLEPETLVNEMSVVLVAADGAFMRRSVGGPRGAQHIIKHLGVPIYDVEDTGYPQRMREKIERDRLLRKREEQRERRARFEERERGGDDDTSSTASGEPAS